MMYKIRKDLHGFNLIHPEDIDKVNKAYKYIWVGFGNNIEYPVEILQERHLSYENQNEGDRLVLMKIQMPDGTFKEGWQYKKFLTKVEEVSEMSEVVITRVGPYSLKIVDNNKIALGCAEVTKAEIELILQTMEELKKPREIKEGDFVKVIKELTLKGKGNIIEISRLLIGKFGRCIKIDHSKPQYPLAIEFAEPFKGGWHCDTIIKDKHGYCFTRDCLELVDAPNLTCKTIFSNKNSVIVYQDHIIIKERSVKVTLETINNVLEQMKNWKAKPEIKEGNYVKIVNSAIDGLNGKFGKVVAKRPEGSLIVEFAEYIPGLQIYKMQENIPAGHGHSILPEYVELIK